MASIFKRRKAKNEPYTIQYVDHLGKRKTVQGFTDKGLSEQLASKLENEAMLRKTGLIDVELEKTLEHKQSPIEEHLKAFEASIQDNSEYYVKQTMFRVRRIINGCGFSNLASINADKVLEFLRSLRTKAGIGHKTYNHHLQAMDAFLNWCVPKRLAANPLQEMERLNTEVDIRHQRRSLAPEEVTRLIEAARKSGKPVQTIAASLRVKLYMIAYMTGLRQKEIASLTPASFRLDDTPPTLAVAAMHSKHRKNDTLPLHPDLVSMLREWLPTLGTSPLFPNLAKKKLYRMIQVDLKLAGIPYETEDGIADFHAAGRHTYITQLIRSGASLPEAKELARHSDIKMTLRYTHIGICDQSKALANLPSVSAIALHGRCKPGVAESHKVASAATSEKSPRVQKRQNPRSRKGLDADCHHVTKTIKVEAGGIEPPSRDTSDPASTCVAN
jgi:integrase